MFGDIGKMLKIAGQLKTKLPEIRERIGNSQFTGQSASGRVTAVVNGKLGLDSLQIAPELVAELTENGRLDVELLSDLIKVAIADGQQKAATIWHLWRGSDPLPDLHSVEGSGRLVLHRTVSDQGRGAVPAGWGTSGGGCLPGKVP